MSFAQNKKKAILTVLSLGFAGVLRMCAATYLNSNDVESMAKQQFTNGDIVFSLDPANTNLSMEKELSLIIQPSC